MKHMYVIEQGKRLYGPFVDVERAVSFGETEFGWGADSTWALRPLSRAEFLDDGGDDEDEESEPSDGPEGGSSAVRAALMGRN